MKMTIEVDAEVANKFLTENLESLSPDEKKQIIKEVLAESAKAIMLDPEGKVKENLLIHYSYGRGYELSNTAHELIKDMSCPEIEELKNLMIKDLIDHHKDIVNRAILNSLAETISHSSAFDSAIRDVIYKIERERSN